MILKNCEFGEAVSIDFLKTPPYSNLLTEKRSNLLTEKRSNLLTEKRSNLLSDEKRSNLLTENGQALIEFLILTLFLLSFIFIASQMTQKAKENIHKYQYKRYNHKKII